MGEGEETHDAEAAKEEARAAEATALENAKKLVEEEDKKMRKKKNSKGKRKKNSNETLPTVSWCSKSTPPTTPTHTPWSHASLSLSTLDVPISALLPSEVSGTPVEILDSCQVWSPEDAQMLPETEKIHSETGEGRSATRFSETTATNEDTMRLSETQLDETQLEEGKRLSETHVDSEEDNSAEKRLSETRVDSGEEDNSRKNGCQRRVFLRKRIGVRKNGGSLRMLVKRIGVR